METTDKGFKGKYNFLSNFYPSPFVLDKLSYKTVEHYYQAIKSTNLKDHEKVRLASTAAMAKKFGRNIDIRPDWEEIKLTIMETALWAKFDQNNFLRKKLLSTGNVQLIEVNWSGDTYWGVCKDVGKNYLGLLLMKLRRQYKIEEKKS